MATSQITSAYYVPPNIAVETIYTGKTSVTEFLDKFELLATGYAWYDEAKTRVIANHLKDSAALWYNSYRHRMATTHANVVWTWPAIRQEMLKVFKNRVSHDSLKKQVRAIRYTMDAHFFVFSVLNILKRINPKMEEDERVTYQSVHHSP